MTELHVHYLNNRVLNPSTREMMVKRQRGSQGSCQRPCGWLRRPGWQSLCQCLGPVSLRLTLNTWESEAQSESRLSRTGNIGEQGQKC